MDKITFPRPTGSRLRLPASVLAAGAACLLLLALPVAQEQTFDLLIRNAQVVDGTGTPWYRADIGVRGDAIVQIGSGLAGTAKRAIDAAGHVVAPGFIDIHTHASRGIFERPTADNYVRQGVTTLLAGPDGSSSVPVAPFLSKLVALGTSVNIGTFVGQGTIRSQVIGDVDRVATALELEKMRELVAQGMRDGAFGLSTGLFYVPGTFTPTDEVVDLARVAGRAGGIHVSHMRDEAGRVLDSVNETIAIGERGGLPTQVTHHKIIGKPNWGRSVETLGAVDRARARGVDVTIDAYPYTASSTSIQSALLPAWAQEGGRGAIMKRLEDAATRTKVEAEVVRIINNERGGGDPRNIQIASCQWDPSLAGKNLAEVTKKRGLTPTVEGAAAIALWIVERGGCQGIFHAIGDEDLDRILRHSATMIASDGEIPAFGVASPHPRSYGTFARVLAVYARDRGLLSLAEAVQKMSAFPAQRLGLLDRGIIRPGMKADLVIFDPQRVRDLATYENPHQYADGLSHVIVNGQTVFENGSMTPARPGAVLYGRGRAARP
jgi:dihydroorotase/N-acyl-D-amino-acid deacylase